jgi:uncharacterized protein YkwD
MKFSRVQRTAFAVGILCFLVLVITAIPQDRPPYATAPHTAAPHPATNTAAQPSSDEQALFDATNRERAALHLQPLEWEPLLAAAARQHALLMSREHEISHQYPGEASLEERAAQAGARFSTIAENIASGPDAAGIHDGWMHSAGHKKNILSPDVTALGVAVIQRGDDLYAVQDFSRPVPNLSLEQQEQKMLALLSPSGLSAVLATADARETCATSVGFSGPQPTAIFRFEITDLSKLPGEVTKAVRDHQYHRAAFGACATEQTTGFVRYRFAMLFY